ncbi:MAG TPA: hypothetical protein VJ850_09930 [Candidatus Limnocylindrales bacterium]|nr:hypothetical protein [Candidatus Limnocylindrales bacterium]
MLASLFPLVLIAHIALAVSLFVPSVLLPFAFRAQRGPRGSAVAVGEAPRDGSNRFVRFMLALQSRGTLWLGLGLAITGVGLIASLGTQTLQQPWLLVALVIYAANLALAYFVQVPRLRRLIGLREGSDPKWADLARRQRYVSYVMAGLVGTIGFLMSTKPALW